MKLTLVDQSNGFLDYNVADAGTIYRVTVSPSIQTGDIFNIFHGDGVYVPQSKRGARFLAKNKPNEPLVSTLERSIRKSYVFVGEHTSSASFVAQAALHFKCPCLTNVLHNLQPTKVLAVDLEYPELSRESPRQMVFKANCPKCHQDTMLTSDLAPAHSIGHTALVLAAQNKAAQLGLKTIDWMHVRVNPMDFLREPYGLSETTEPLRAALSGLE